MSSTTKNKARPAATQATVGATRFEHRRRALRRRWWLKVAAVVALISLVAVGFWAVTLSPLLAVETVQVIGLHRTTKGQIEQAAQVPSGVPLIKLDLAAIERRVAVLTDVASVTVSSSYPHTVRIVVVERIPVAVAGASFGPFRLIDSSGIDLGPASERPKGLPLIALDPATSDPATFRSAAGVAAELPAPLAAKVERISASSPDGVTLDLVGGAQVRWGGSDRGPDKVQVLAALLVHRARIYDVSAPDTPTTTS